LRSGLLVILAALPAGVAAQQRRLTAWEAGVGGVAVLARGDFYGAALQAGYRAGGQARLSGAVAPGVVGDRAAIRADAAAEFMVMPAVRRGVGVYGGAGLGYQAAVGGRGAAFMSARIGVERAPGGRFGWYLEAGVGGGVRLAGGVRWRWFPSWW
jgi:hypothetical protein